MSLAVQKRNDGKNLGVLMYQFFIAMRVGAKRNH